jgi:hypothetical protein
VVARHIARAKSLFCKHSGDVGDMGDRFDQVANSPAPLYVTRRPEDAIHLRTRGTLAVAMSARQDPLESTKVQAPRPWLV